MRTTLLAAAAAFTLALGTAGFAAESGVKGNPDDSKQGQQADQASSSVDNNCDAILANKASHPAADVERCKAKK